MFFINHDATEVTRHRYPGHDALERRPKPPGLNLSIQEPEEPAPSLGGYRRAYEDEEGAWRLAGSGRLVAHPKR